MSSIACASALYVKRGANRAHLQAVPAAAGVRRFARLFAVVLGAAWLAACAQSSMVSRRTTFVAPSVAPTRQAALERHRYTHFRPTRIATREHPSVVRREAAAASDDGAGKKTQPASQGLASFYTEEQETASGEKFDTHELTAAHPTLPFGTRLRVTNVATGRSVTVRVNDRGPYVRGRVVDVSYSAAEALGMVGQGVAKVKLDVVQKTD